jgi:ABC-type dipeptide/oligopeptide/nickel transport system permease component
MFLNSHDLKMLIYFCELFLGLFLACTGYFWLTTSASGIEGIVYAIPGVVLLLVGIIVFLLGLESFFVRDDPELWR